MLRTPILFTLGAVLACGQSMVEYSLGTAHAASASAGLKAAGKAAANVLENASKTLDKAATSTTIVLPAQPSAEAAKPPAFRTPKPGEIPAGMEREELVRKFGEPVMKIASAGETWWYGTGANTVTVRLENGKVTRADFPVAAAAAPKDTPKKDDAVVTLPR
jgi:hypothetical protein